MFFDPQDVLKEGMFLNFVVSSRGAGKTYSSLKALIQGFIERKEQFIYVRRTETELKEALPTLFNAHITQEEFPETELRVKGVNFLCDGEVMGRGMAISTAYKFKSTAFPNVKYILFDEFISESGSYLKDEQHKFLSLIETVGRMREIQVVCLANQDTIYNPYYIYFGVRPASPTTPKTRFRKSSVMIYQFQSEEYKAAKRETNFGRLITGTTYGGFILDNESFKDDYSFIDSLEGEKKEARFNITVEGVDMTVYDVFCEEQFLLWVCKRSPVAGIPSYNLDKVLREERQIESIRGSRYLKRLKLYTDRGLIRFKDVPTKNLISSIIF